VIPWLSDLFGFLLAILPGGLWMGFWLFGVDWRRLWPYLAEGAWMPCLLLGVMSAFVWSRIAPAECNCLRVVTVPNFWWQLGAVGALGAVALFSGWLQGQMGYAPFAVRTEPIDDHELTHPEGHGHDHEHGHGHVPDQPLIHD
jgi:hypothetical protein